MGDDSSVMGKNRKNTGAILVRKIKTGTQRSGLLFLVTASINLSAGKRRVNKLKTEREKWELKTEGIELNLNE